METEIIRADETTHENENDLRKWAVRILKVIGNIVFAFFMLLAVFLLFCLAQSKITGGAPKIAGHYALVVLSGSMSPTFDTGSVVFVKPVSADEIQKGDVITFRGFAGSDAFTTHRVVEIHQAADGPTFTTKGDANRTDDPDPTPGRDLIGKAGFSIPFLGYFMNFSQTRYGLLAFIVIPGILLVVSECRSLFLNYTAAKKEPQEGKPQNSETAQAAGKE